MAIVQAGETQGLRWELQRIGASLQAEQVILFVPFGLWCLPKSREKLYSSFRDWAQEDLGTELPQQIGHSCFIYFTAGPSAVGPWYYAHGKKKVGPVAMTQLQDLLSRGVLTSHDMVLEDGAPRWRPLKEVIEIDQDGEWQAHTLNRNQQVVKDHPLAKILVRLQKNRSLWPRRTYRGIGVFGLFS